MAQRRRTDGEGSKQPARRKARTSAGSNGKSKAPSPRYSRDWMATFLDDALMTGDLLAACGKAGISLLEYRRERARDPYFDEGCLQVDQVVKLAIISNLEAQAASGSIQAATLLAKGLGELREAIRPEDPRTAIKGHVSPSGLISVIAPPGLHPLVLRALDETLFRCNYLVAMGRPEDLRRVETEAGMRCPSCEAIHAPPHWLDPRVGGEGGWPDAATDHAAEGYLPGREAQRQELLRQAKPPESAAAAKK